MQQIVKYDKLHSQSRHFQEFQDLVIEHRLQHENFKESDRNRISDSDSTASSVSHSNKHHEEQGNFKKPDNNEFMSRSDDTQGRISNSSSFTQQKSEGRQNNLKKSVSPTTKDTSSNVVNNIPSSDLSTANLHQTVGNGVWKSEHQCAAILIQVRFTSWLMYRQSKDWTGNTG